MRINPIYVVLFVVTAVFAMAAQASEWDISSVNRERSEALRATHAQPGRVLQVRWVEVSPTNTENTVSATVGGLLGAAIGAQVGKGNTARVLGGTLGAIFGGIAGNKVGDYVSAVRSQEVIVRMDGSGEVLSVTQADSDLQPGQPVYVLSDRYYGGKVRIVPRYDF